MLLRLHVDPTISIGIVKEGWLHCVDAQEVDGFYLLQRPHQ